VHIGPNTLYLGDTPVLGTANDTINIQADSNQTINMRTTGTGYTQVTSEKGVEISATGLNSQINVQSTGAGGKIVFGASNKIDFTAPSITITGNATVNSNLTVKVVIVNGNFTATGSSFVANVTTVEVQDNIILLNKGQTGSGVSAGTAGISVE